MIYYNEQGVQIPESEIDLQHGYLEDRDILHQEYVPAVTHIDSIALPNGEIITYTVTDSPAIPEYDKVISQTYYYTGPTKEEKMEAQLMYTALITDTLLEETEEDILVSESEVVDNV